MSPYERNGTYRLDDEFEGNTMRLGGFPVEIECRNETLVALHIELFLRDFLRVKRYVLIQCSDSKVMSEFLVQLAVLCLINSDSLH